MRIGTTGSSASVLLKASAGLAWCLLLGWFFIDGRQVPLLSLVDLGFHELGHLLFYLAPWDLLTAVMGSVMQIAVPLGLAAYFWWVRKEAVSSAVCLAWAGTSAWGVHAYMADAPFERLQLIGGDHDWAFILHDLDQMAAAPILARVVWILGLLCLMSGVALSLWLPWRHTSADRNRQLEELLRKPEFPGF